MTTNGDCTKKHLWIATVVLTLVSVVGGSAFGILVGRDTEIVQKQDRLEERIRSTEQAVSRFDERDAARKKQLDEMSRDIKELLRKVNP